MREDNDLAEQQCTACRGGVAPLTPEQIKPYSEKLGSDWEVHEDHHLEKAFRFDDFVQALDFTNKVGRLAEEQNHHPNIFLTWGCTKIQIWTHKINGLHENDFILAAKIDHL